MRLGLLSDTHIPEAVPELPDSVTKAFKGVDLILHGGDIFSPAVLDSLQKLAPVLCARGDDDYYRSEDLRIKSVHHLTIEGMSLSLVHSLYFPYTSPYPSSSWQKEEFQKELEKAILSRLGLIPKIIVFGHTHKAFIQEYDSLYMVNPGSATFPDYQSKPGTVAIMEINASSIKTEIIKLS